MSFCTYFLYTNHSKAVGQNKAKGKVIVLIVLYLLLAVLVILNAYVEKYSVGLCVLSGGIALVGVYFAILHIVALTKMK